MLMYVSTALFAGAAPTDYVYFCSLFGDPNASNDGFEEWALLLNSGGGGTGQTAVPEPASLLPLKGDTGRPEYFPRLGLGCLSRNCCQNSLRFIKMRGWQFELDRTLKSTACTGYVACFRERQTEMELVKGVVVVPLDCFL
jgi:hypothetical protein